MAINPGQFQQWRGQWIPRVLPAPSEYVRIRYWDITTGEEFPSMIGCQGPIVFSPDGQLLATRTVEGGIKIWELPPRKPLGMILAWSCLPASLLLLFAWWRGRRRVESRIPEVKP